MIRAEWIWYMDAYRVYDSKSPERTMVYADDKEELREVAERLGEKIKEVRK